jgi:hypothetical protein
LLAAAASLSSACLALAWSGIYGLHSIAVWRYGVLLAGEGAAALLGWIAVGERLLAWRRGGTPSAGWTSGRIAAYVSVFGAGVILIAFQPFHPFFVLLNLGVQAGVFSGLVLWIHRRPHFLPAHSARRLDRLALSLCLTLLAIEGGLRLAARISDLPLLDTHAVSAEDNLRRHRFAPGRPFLGMRTDSRGFHDQELALEDGERLVVCLGDSFGFGIVPHLYHFTTVAESNLAQVEIYNMGVNACGLAEYDLLLEREALPLSPAAILVSVFIGNDVLEARRFHPDHRLARMIYDRDFFLLWQIPSRLARVDRERTEGNLQDELWRDEQLVEPTREALSRRFPWLFDHRAETPSFTLEAFLDIEAFRAREMCDPKKTAKYDAFFAALEEMRRRAGSTPFLVMLIPDEFQVEDGLWEQVLEHLGRPASLDRDFAQRRVKAWLEERRVPCLDLLPVLREVPALEDGNRHLYALRDTHFNRRGNEAAGVQLAEFLAQQLE